MHVRQCGPTGRACPPPSSSQTNAARRQRQSGNLLAIVWHDNRDVRTLGTNTNPEVGVVKRRVGKKVVNVSCPLTIIHYNVHIYKMTCFHGLGLNKLHYMLPIFFQANSNRQLYTHIAKFFIV